MIADAPRLIVLVLLLLELSIPQVQFWPFVLRVPVVTVTVLATVITAFSSRVRSLLFMVTADTLAAAVTVTVAAVPLLVSKVTVSAEVGAATEAAPPEVVAKWLVVPSQLPVPPTQK
jgi:hypothetical protein